MKYRLCDLADSALHITCAIHSYCFINMINTQRALYYSINFPVACPPLLLRGLLMKNRLLSRLIMHIIHITCKKYVTTCASVNKYLLTLIICCTPMLSIGASWDDSYFPNSTVVTHTGEKLKFYDDLIKDKVVVVNFIYTSCKDICPLQSARLNKLQVLLGDFLGTDVFIYSISLTPDIDTPEELNKQAQAFKAKPGWLFITGKPKDLETIRYKLGERNADITQHGNQVMLGNGKTGRWRRDSLFQKPERLADNIFRMDPKRFSKGMSEGKNKAQISSLSLRPNPINKQGLSYQAKAIHQQTGQGLFIKACQSCHSIGQGIDIGPDLLNITQRRSRAWLIRFIMEPDRVMQEKDATALALNQAFPDIIMPNLGLSKTDASDVLVYIETQSKKHTDSDVKPNRLEKPISKKIKP